MHAVLNLPIQEYGVSRSLFKFSFMFLKVMGFSKYWFCSFLLIPLFSVH